MILYYYLIIKTYNLNSNNLNIIYKLIYNLKIQK